MSWRTKAKCKSNTWSHNGVGEGGVRKCAFLDNELICNDLDVVQCLSSMDMNRSIKGENFQSRLSQDCDMGNNAPPAFVFSR